MKKIDNYINGAGSIAISGHIRPDGDCVGSVLALYNYIQANYPDINVDVYLEKPAARFGFLKGFDKIKICGGCEDTASTQETAQYDLMVSLDCSTVERLGGAYSYFRQSKYTICLDHHISNTGFADENYIYPDASSACEVLYGFLDDEKLNLDIATCLYVGIVSDTGIFKYPSTSPETMRIAARLMEFGIDTNRVIDDSFSSMSWNESRILGYALSNSSLAFGGKVICSCITENDMKRYNVTARELDGIVAQLRQVNGVVCAVLIYETGEYEYKVSFRSEAPFDVNALAGAFGGGGHVRAAGCNVRGELETCLEAILLKISDMEGYSFT